MSLNLIYYFIRQRNNFFRIPNTIEMAKNWVIEEIEKEMLETVALESTSSPSVESPAMSSSDTGSSLEQIRKKMRLERQQQVKCFKVTVTVFPSFHMFPYEMMFI